MAGSVAGSRALADTAVVLVPLVMGVQMLPVVAVVIAAVVVTAADVVVLWVAVDAVLACRRYN